jgi:hypothetical protein
MWTANRKWPIDAIDMGNDKQPERESICFIVHCGLEANFAPHSSPVGPAFRPDVRAEARTHRLKEVGGTFLAATYPYC